MKRYVVAILVTMLFASVGEIHKHLPEASKQPVVTTLKAADDNKSAEELSLEILHNDILRAGSTSSNSVVQRGDESENSQARHRNPHTLKSAVHATPCRHAGHVTDILNFNHYTSSLRVGYYLHSLCRLRI
ncbi:MAG: hypothetical protein IIY05_06175 [Alistipes sp.]|nr:hypothetical protein [Alistipes sp.]